MADLLTSPPCLAEAGGGQQGELVAFFRAAAREPFAFGPEGWDCSMWMANWVRQARGVDPGASLRGRYADDAAWRSLEAAAGGLLGLVAGCFEGAGLCRVPIDEARPGDVAVVTIEGAGMTTGAIRGLSGGWLLKLNRGVCRLRCQPLAVWRV